MKPATHIQPRKRSVDNTTNWDICFLCQKKSNTPTRKLGSNGLEQVQHALSERKKYHDYAKWDVVERLDAVNFQSLSGDTEFVYHKDCYGTFTSAMHLRRLKKKFETKICAEEGASTSESDQTSKVLRSKVKAFNTDLCVFCQQTSKEKTRLAASVIF